MAFRDGFTDSALDIVGSVGKRNTGTRLRFWPDPKYFDTAKFALRALRHLLRAKAVLCAGLKVSLLDEVSGERDAWYYERSEEHTSELQSLMRISYAVFCLK